MLHDEQIQFIIKGKPYTKLIESNYMVINSITLLQKNNNSYEYLQKSKERSNNINKQSTINYFDFKRSVDVISKYSYDIYNFFNS